MTWGIGEIHKKPSKTAIFGHGGQNLPKMPLFASNALIDANFGQFEPPGTAEVRKNDGLQRSDMTQFSCTRARQTQVLN